MLLGEQITKRLIDKTLTEIRIATNPTLDPAEATKFVEELMDKRKALWGTPANNAPLDKEALLLLKDRLKNSSKSIAVK